MTEVEKSIGGVYPERIFRSYGRIRVDGYPSPFRMIDLTSEVILQFSHHE